MQTETVGIIDSYVTIIEDNPSLPVAAQVSPIDVKSNIAVFDPIKLALAELAAIINNTPYDITTTAGEEIARGLRSRCVQLRTGTAALYKERNTPLLELQRQMRKLVTEIEAGIEPHETKLDNAIKEKDRMREAERQRKLAIEEARVQALRARITAVAGMPARAALMDASAIKALVGELQAIEGASFEEFADEFEGLATTIGSQLTHMLTVASAREAETERNRLESLRLEAERQQLVQQAAEDRAALQKLTDAANEAARLRDVQAAAESARQAAAADQRQRDAEAESARAAKVLKDQQDAFEAERQSALAEQQAERARLAADRKVLQDQVDAMAAAKAAAALPAPEPVVEVKKSDLDIRADSALANLVACIEADPAFDRNSTPSDVTLARVVAEYFNVEITQAIYWLEAFNAQQARDELAELTEEIPA